MKPQILFFALIFCCISIVTLAQDNLILPAQSDAIIQLSRSQEFSDIQLQEYVYRLYGKPLNTLTRVQAAELIRLFQSPLPKESFGQTPKPSISVQQTISPKSVVKQELATQSNDRGQLIAQLLEIGMSKRFHLVDGNIITATIVKIDSGICYLQTTEAILQISTSDILEETAEVFKRDESKYIGPVIKETSENISIRSKYGDVTIDKKDIRDMNRFHGGKLVPWAEEKKRFYRSQVSLTDIFNDPTAFPLEANAMYISGLSIGYGFTETFMVRTSFGNNFNGDLNIKPLWQFYYDHSATQRTGIAVGADLYSRHQMVTEISKYARYIRQKSNNKLLSDETNLTPIEKVIAKDYRQEFFGEFYVVYSKLWPLESGRGEMGYHFGIKTSTLPFVRSSILDTAYQWTSEKINNIPFRLWGAFEYDLTKNLKFSVIAWADNAYRYRTLSEVREDYLSDGTPFTLDAKGGEYRTIDFDFGFLYAVNDSFRIGIHFKETYLQFFWRLLEL